MASRQLLAIATSNWNSQVAPGEQKPQRNPISTATTVDMIWYGFDETIPNQKLLAKTIITLCTRSNSQPDTN